MSHDFSKEDNGYDSTYEDDEESKYAKRARRDLAEPVKYDKKSKAKVS